MVSEFGFFNLKVDIFALKNVLPKKLKMAKSAHFNSKIEILRALLHNKLYKFDYVNVPSKVQLCY